MANSSDPEKITDDEIAYSALNLFNRLFVIWEAMQNNDHALAASAMDTELVFVLFSMRSWAVKDPRVRELIDDFKLKLRSSAAFSNNRERLERDFSIAIQQLLE